MPQIQYFLPGGSPTGDTDPIWRMILPSRRSAFAGDISSTGADASMRCGDYFQAVQRFLQRDGWHRLTAAIREQTQQAPDAADLRRIGIHLEKYGQYYHPARITVDFDSRHTAFVLNVSTGATGAALIENDWRNLRRLNRDLPHGFLPQVYDLDSVELEGPDGVRVPRRSVTMFLGQWLEGFHEFHLSSPSPGGRLQTLVWDAAAGNRPLTARRRRRLYRRCAEILTAYFNLTTLEHIAAWHHAAGDFVVADRRGRTDARLVTVREYVPLLQNVQPDAGAVLPALLLFLLKTSVRMRLDRLDGTGDVAWAGDDVVGSTVAGFFDGLERQQQHGTIPEGLTGVFRQYLRRITPSELSGMLAMLVDGEHPDTPGRDLMAAGREAHATALFNALKADN
jgi:hypothetical protein